MYETLYKCSDSSEEMKSIDGHIKHLIQGQNSSEAVEKMSEKVVLDVIHSLKKHKMDVSNSFNSDSLLNAPDILSFVLSKVFKCWLYHGKITRSILVCAFIPLLKSSLKDPASTDSYRAIAGSSLILKVFEKCILKVWGENLGSDSLQFGFKKRCSTTTATWLVQEVLQHYVRKGSKPIAVVLDCSRAFDLARFDKLFGRLLERIPAIVVRALCYSYKEQLGWVKWGRHRVSETFALKNGTRQGLSASPTFWAVYLNPLLEELRQLGVGCHVAGVFVGVVAFADDLILLAPCRSAAQLMLSHCEDCPKK